MTEKLEIKSMLKREYADLLDISLRTLRKYLNIVFISDLQKLNYNKNQHLLLPNQIKFLNEKLCNYTEM